MRQPLATMLRHASAASSHESEVHVRPSEHAFAAPVHVAAAVQVSETVQKRPSLHAMPVRGVHALLLEALWHDWHGFDESTTPFE